MFVVCLEKDLRGSEYHVVPGINKCTQGQEGFAKGREYVCQQVFGIDVDREMAEVERSSMSAFAMCSIREFCSDAIVCFGFVQAVGGGSNKVTVGA